MTCKLHSKSPQDNWPMLVELRIWEEHNPQVPPHSRDLVEIGGIQFVKLSAKSPQEE